MLSNEEKETIILFDKSSPECTIYTADRTIIHKLDKTYRCIKEENCGGEISKTYLTNKKHISFRKDASFTPVMPDKSRRTLSPEHISKLQSGRHRQQIEAVLTDK